VLALRNSACFQRACVYSPECVEGVFSEDEMRRPTPHTQYP
jgi:hypothetical protein